MLSAAYAEKQQKSRYLEPSRFRTTTKTSQKVAPHLVLSERAGIWQNSPFFLRMLKYFQMFLEKMKANFRRISRATRNDVPIEDLENDAFVLALDIGERRGSPIDFSNPEDQELVMRALYVEKVKRGDWNLRRSVRIDHELEGEEEGGPLVDRLPARESSDPLVLLLELESFVDTDAMLAASYSQATAYAITFRNFNNDRKKVCMHLVISGGVLSRRVTNAADTVMVQPSIFDCIERVPSDFMPPQGRAYAARIEDAREAAQTAWCF